MPIKMLVNQKTEPESGDNPHSQAIPWLARASHLMLALLCVVPQRCGVGCVVLWDVKHRQCPVSFGYIGKTKLREGSRLLIDVFSKSNPP